MSHKQGIVFALVSLLLVALLGLQIIPRLRQNVVFLLALRPLLNSTFAIPGHYDSCSNLNGGAYRLFTDGQLFTGGQRLAIGGALISLKCLDLAVRVLPELGVFSERPELLSYQWGVIAWGQDDATRAATIWRKSRGIDRRLLAQARSLREKDVSQAQRWYEAAIMSASSPQTLAESITAYSEELRGMVSSEIMKGRLDHLASYFGVETPVGYRLRGERSLQGGSYQKAFDLFLQAISLGMNDAETWYLLGDAAWKLNDLPTTEQAYRAALQAPIQIPWRRPWHLNRLASLLRSEGRLSEALLYQEEAARLSDYYAYTDSLAVLYAELGQVTKAQILCAKARSLASSMQTTLRCEGR